MTDHGYDLRGKVALVTGASRGVGAAVAMALADAGARVACAARSTAASPQRTPGTLDGTVSRIREAGGEAVAVPTNLADPAEVEAMVASTVAELGRLDILVNNAAITFVGDLNIPLARHDLVMAVNLQAPSTQFSPPIISRSFMPALQETIRMSNPMLGLNTLKQSSRRCY